MYLGGQDVQVSSLCFAKKMQSFVDLMFVLSARAITVSVFTESWSRDQLIQRAYCVANTKHRQPVGADCSWNWQGKVNEGFKGLRTFKKVIPFTERTSTTTRHSRQKCHCGERSCWFISSPTNYRTRWTGKLLVGINLFLTLTLFY